MKKTPSTTRTSAIRQTHILPGSSRAASAGVGRPKAGARYKDPLDYEQHPYDSMKRFAQLLALRYDMIRTRHSYYRDLRLLHEHYGSDPAALTEEQLREYILHVKTRKHWKPKTIRQSAAAARLFFVDLMEREEWKVFSQIRAKDHDELPAVLSRDVVRRLLARIHLRRYRIPIKLIYCAGLRLSECLSLTIHDIREQRATPIIEKVAGIELLAGGALPGWKPQPVIPPNRTGPEARGEKPRVERGPGGPPWDRHGTDRAPAGATAAIGYRLMALAFCRPCRGSGIFSRLPGGSTAPALPALRASLKRTCCQGRCFRGVG